MAAFTYDAINAQGLQLKGELHAADVVSAQEQLRSRGLMAQNLIERRAKGEAGARTAFKKVKAKSLQVFFRQLATMIEAGVSVVAALVTLEEQTDDKYLREVIAEIRSDVEAGMVLSQAFARHPKVFNRLYVSLIEAGESSGTLDEVLDRAATQIEKETQLKRRVRGAMIYPGCRDDLRLAGPHLHAAVHHPGLRRRLRPAGRRAAEPDAVRDGDVERAAALVVHHLPGHRGGHLRAATREAHRKGPAGLGSLQAPDPDEDRRRRAEDRAGPHVADAGDARRRRRRHHHGARDHGHTAGNWVIEQSLANVRERVHEGVPIGEPLTSDPVFPPMLGQMVKIGEETGELEKMLSKVADFYEDEVDASIQSLTSIIEPVLMIGVGAMVGSIVISMYLPMFKMMTLIK